MNKVSYAMGMNIAQQLINSDIKDFNVDDFTQAVKDFTSKKDLKMTGEEANSVLDAYYKHLNEEMKAEQEKVRQKAKKEGEEFLSATAKHEGVVKTKSGLLYKVIKEGTGKQPTAHDRVQCDYVGKFIDGREFDSSYKRGQSMTFFLNQVIPGWAEGLQLMKEGGKCEFYIPYTLGYGENGIRNAIPGCSTLIFTVELHKVL